MFSFEDRNRQLEVHSVLRRVMDESSPNRPPEEGDSRWEDRSCRTIPVVLAPYDDGRPIVDEATIALTKDISSQGMALVLTHPFRAGQVVVGIRQEDHLECLLGEIRQNAPLGAGFWQIGIELIEHLMPTEHPGLSALAPLAQKLKAPSRPSLPSFSQLCD